MHEYLDKICIRLTLAKIYLTRSESTVFMDRRKVSGWSVLPRDTETNRTGPICFSQLLFVPDLTTRLSVPIDSISLHAGIFLDFSGFSEV